MEQMAERKFKPLWRVSLGDWEKGLIVAVLGAAIGVLYEAFTGPTPITLTWLALQPVLMSALKGAIVAALAYIGKNFGTGANGKLLTNAPPSPSLEKK